MKAWNDIQGDFNQDKRDPKPGEYSVVAVGGVGRVSCYRKGMTITDFYNNGPLINDIPVRGAEPVTTELSDAKVVVGRTGGATPPTGATPKEVKP